MRRRPPLDRHFSIHSVATGARMGKCAAGLLAKANPHLPRSTMSRVLSSHQPCASMDVLRRSRPKPTPVSPDFLNFRLGIGVWLAYRAFVGWSSQVARRSHKPEVGGSNPSPATTKTTSPRSSERGFCCFWALLQRCRSSLSRASNAGSRSPHTNARLRQHSLGVALQYSYMRDVGWSSQVARRSHKPEVGGSNPSPATTNNKPAFFGTRVLLFRVQHRYTASSAVACHSTSPTRAG